MKYRKRDKIRMWIRLIVCLLVLSIAIGFAGNKALVAGQHYMEKVKEDRAIAAVRKEAEEESRSIEESIQESIALEESIRESQSIEESRKEATRVKEIRHEYQVIHGDLTWNEAKEAAEAAGGYLATITSQEEMDTVLQHIYSWVDTHDEKLIAVWLGAYNLTGNGFNWVNGEDFTYSYWAPNEPNNADGIEHYLVMYKVKGNWVWNDAPNVISDAYPNKIGYVIEKEYEVD
ncbi:MAG: C-type lectin domain-containing protein [Lachnospiraceae bacterium]|nr:C-type lectin domain-containing protein [Lachnospiraceae bacterium]